jgi:hypothetical protein
MGERGCSQADRGFAGQVVVSIIRHCEPKAKQSSPLEALDCFVASASPKNAPRNDGN